MFRTSRLGGSSLWARNVFLVLFLPGTAPYIGITWGYILRFLRMAQEENDMLALCHGEGQEGLGKTLLELGRKEETESQKIRERARDG